MRRKIICKLGNGGVKVRTISSPPNGFSAKHVEGFNSIVLEKKWLLGRVQVISSLCTQSCDYLLHYHPKLSKSSETCYFIFSILNNNLSPFPWGIHGICYCVLGQVVVDRFFFTPDTTPSSQIDDISLGLLDTSYCGPQLSQGFLVTALAGKLPIINNNLVYPASDSSFFSSQLDFFTFFSFNHFPVHSVNEDILEAVSIFLESYGINDSLAEYLEAMTSKKKEDEKQRWKSSLLRVLVKN